MPIQYVGPRYVPQLEGEWNINKAYESLSIVTYQNSSYTSKKPVPIGIQITNTEYWIETGITTGQIVALQKQLNALSVQTQEDISQVNEKITNEISDLSSQTSTQLNQLDTTLSGKITQLSTSTSESLSEVDTKINNINENINSLSTQIKGVKADVDNQYNFYNKYYLLMGDSYGTGYTPDGNVTGWCALLKTQLENAGATVDSVPVFGAGWMKENNTYLQQYQAAPNKDKYTHIVLCAGYNDKDLSITQINTAMLNFITAVRSGSPKAKFIFGNIGEHAKDANIRAKLAVIDAKLSQLTVPQVTIIPHAFELLHSKNLFSSDGFHPNQAGENLISNSLFKYLAGSPLYMYYGEYFDNNLGLQTLDYNIGIRYYRNPTTSQIENKKTGSYILLDEDITQNGILMPATMRIELLKPYLLGADLNGTRFYGFGTILFIIDGLSLGCYIFAGTPGATITNVTNSILEVARGTNFIPAKYI